MCAAGGRVSSSAGVATPASADRQCAPRAGGVRGVYPRAPALGVSGGASWWWRCVCFWLLRGAFCLLLRLGARPVPSGLGSTVNIRCGCLVGSRWGWVAPITPPHTNPGGATKSNPKPPAATKSNPHQPPTQTHHQNTTTHKPPKPQNNTKHLQHHPTPTHPRAEHPQNTHNQHPPQQPAQKPKHSWHHHPKERNEQHRVGDTARAGQKQRGSKEDLDSE